jgi:glycosyltransferase involved in cell wall biosynthesis
MASKQINIVPLLAGSGIRVKIIEAMSIGKPVISTTIGAEGIKYTDGKDILIANTPEEFLHQIERCLNTPQLLEHIGSNAHSLAMKEYDNNALSKRLVDFYNKIIEKTLSES